MQTEGVLPAAGSQSAQVDKPVCSSSRTLETRQQDPKVDFLDEIDAGINYSLYDDNTSLHFTSINN